MWIFAINATAICPNITHTKKLPGASRRKYKPKMHKQLVLSPNHGTKCAGTVPKHKQRHASKH